MIREKRINLEYEMFLNRYSIKQISKLLNVSYLKVIFDINRIERNKKGLRISFN